MSGSAVDDVVEDLDFDLVRRVAGLNIAVGLGRFVVVDFGRFGRFGRCVGGGFWASPR